MNAMVMYTHERSNMNAELYERMLLRSVLDMCDMNTKAGAVDEMLTALSVKDFSNLNRVYIFNSIKDLRKNGTVDSAKAYAAIMGNEQAVNEFNIMLPISTSSDVQFLIDKVKEFSVIRQAQMLSNGFLNGDYEKNIDTFQTFADNVAKLKIDSTGVKQDLDTTKTISRFMKELHDRTNHVNDIRGRRTGLPTLDKVSSGLHPGDLITIGALPGMGKTTLALTIATVDILNGGTPYIFTFEMNEYTVIANMISIMSLLHKECQPISRDTILNPKGKITKSNLNTIEYCSNIIHDSGAVIVDRKTPRSSRTTNLIRSVCYKGKGDGNITMAIIDHLGLMVKDHKYEREEIADMTVENKALACEIGIPVLQLSQLNVRDSKGISRPNIGMFKGSSTIEQDSDLCLMPWRPYAIDKQGDPSESYIFNAKSREFHGVDIETHFDTSAVMYYELAEKRDIW